MTVVATNLLVNNSGSGATSYTTAPANYTAGRLYLFTFISRTSIIADPTQPTATGTGLTLTVVNSVVFDNTSSSRRRLTVFRALPTSNTTTTITFDEAGQPQTNADWAVDELTSIDTTGTNGDNAIVQSATNFTNNTTVTATLAAFGSTNNATFGAGGSGLSTLSAGSGFTALSSQADSVSTGEISMFQSTNNTSVTVTQTTGAEIGVIGIEVRAASGGSGTPTNLFFY